jgi:hypothetical protein
MTKVLESRVGADVWMNGEVVLKSKNFELKVNLSIYGVSLNMYDYIDNDDKDMDIMYFKFRGDVAKMDEVESRLRREGMTELVRELEELKEGNYNDDVKNNILKKNKTYLKNVFKGAKLDRFYSTLSQEEKNEVMLTYYIENLETLTDKCKPTRQNFLMRCKVVLSEEQKANPKLLKHISLKWLKKQLAKNK